MMSFFVEGQKGRDKSTQLCALAIQHIYSLGLHHSNRLSGGRNGYAVRLLCCMWALDRLNAAFHGKPVPMHEHDFSIDMHSCIHEQAPCFQLFLRVVSVLDKVIDLYRPHNGSEENDLERDFPSFEYLITQSNAVQVPLRHLGKSNVTAIKEWNPEDHDSISRNPISCRLHTIAPYSLMGWICSRIECVLATNLLSAENSPNHQQ